MKQHFIFLAAVAGALFSANAEPAGGDINPALTYYQAFSVRPDLSPADRDYLFTNLWRGRPLPARAGELLSQYDDEFRLARAAAHSTAPCDWGIDWKTGPGTLLPQLAPIKHFAVVARLRVMWALQQGRQADARDDLLAALAMGRNGAHGDALIGALVEIAVERIVCVGIAENFSRFTPDILQQLADGLNGPPARGTIAESMALEKSVGPDCAVAKIQQAQKEFPGNDVKAMESIRDVFAIPEGDGEAGANRWPQLVAASGGSAAGMIRLLTEVAPFYARLSQIETLPVAQYEEQIKQFNADVTNSGNPFALESLPAMEKCRPREFAVLAELGMVQAAVAYKLHGDQGLREVADPCGQGPFTLQRFMFDGQDRGFELSSPYAGQGWPTVLIFVESDGPPFTVDTRRAGEPATQ